MRTGGPLPVQPEDAVDVLRVLEAAVRSSERGEVVAAGGRLPPAPVAWAV